LRRSSRAARTGGSLPSCASEHQQQHLSMLQRRLRPPPPQWLLQPQQHVKQQRKQPARCCVSVTAAGSIPGSCVAQAAPSTLCNMPP
jgi:hypothetical protein